MPGGFGSQVWINDYLPRIKNRIVDEVSGMNKSLVFESMQGQEFHLSWPIADRFITLFNHDFPVDQTMVTGGGSYNTAFDSTLESTVYCRVESDQEGWSVQQLEAHSIGVNNFILNIITALHMWDGPVAEDGRQMFRRPMRIRPGFRILPKSGRDKTRWAVAPISWEVSFVSSLGFNYPGG